MKNLLSMSLLLASILGSSVASADVVTSEPNEYGKVTKIGRGVWSFEGDALGVLSSATQDGATATRFTTDGAITVSRFVGDNVAIGGSVLASYDTIGGNDYSMQFGGAVVASYYFRLGLGAFFRPGVSAGVLVGNHNTPTTGGLMQQDSEVGFLGRLQLPVAYFTSKRFQLHAGPQLDIVAGQVTPPGKDATSFTRVAGGFEVGAGYMF